MYRPGMDGVGVVFVLTWHEWKWGGLSADLKGMDLGCLCTDLALMDLGCLCTDLALMDLECLCTDLALMDLGWSVC